MIEHNVIPLMAFSQNNRSLSDRPGELLRGQAPVPSLEDIHELARLVLLHDASVAKSYVETLKKDGVALEVLLLELLAPTARLLGDYWVEDTRDFAEVTIGLGRLQQVLHSITRVEEDQVPLRLLRFRRRALLVAAPGEQHTFGVVMVADFFRRHGWDVTGGHMPTMDEIGEMVSGQEFDLVGLSLSRDGGIDSVGETIRAIRRVSRNSDVQVMVGGRVFNEQPEMASAVEADLTAGDGRHALKTAEEKVLDSGNG